MWTTLSSGMDIGEITRVSASRLVGTRKATKVDEMKNSAAEYVDIR